MKNLTKSSASNAFLDGVSEGVKKSAAKALDNTPIAIKPAKKIESEARYDVQNVVNTELGKGKNLEKLANEGKLQIRAGENISLEGGTDYYMSGPNVLGEVGLENGNVTGVNTSKEDPIKPGYLQRK